MPTPQTAEQFTPENEEPEPDTPTKHSFTVHEGETQPYPPPNWEENAAHFNSPVFPTMVREPLEETGKANRRMATINTARNEVRDDLRRSIKPIY